MRREELVVVGAYATRTEAELAQGALEADGLTTMIAADDVGGQYAAIWPASVACSSGPKMPVARRTFFSRPSALTTLDTDPLVLRPFMLNHLDGFAAIFGAKVRNRPALSVQNRDVEFDDIYSGAKTVGMTAHLRCSRAGGTAIARDTERCQRGLHVMTRSVARQAAASV